MDKRVKNTRKQLKQALLDLLKEKPVEKITVTALCEKAKVNRVTFYKHYEDIYDLLNKIELSYVKELRNNKHKFGNNRNPDYLWLVKFVEKHADFYKVTFINNIQTKFMDEFYDELKCYYCESFENKNYSERELNYMFEFMKGGVNFVFIEWFKSGLSDTCEQIAELVEDIFMNFNYFTKSH